MNERTLAGAFGVSVVGCTVVLGVYGLVSGYLLESAGDLLVPSAATLAVVIVVVAALVGLGTGGSRRLATPYW
ncbi:hypothetical protein [Natrialba sp. INN-245]|uniref:hypothetical protein n=1 Tax=Natrialba sp. INN-245 TaxID=2690967 RepID=UPI0013109458|nr:hypothetical protein [Natrialba sp. INN-245]MWV39749.1 hypothetical protein [Natrialba sp. INN-245]